MTDITDDVVPGAVPGGDEPQPSSGALSARMERRATQLDHQTSDWFPVPGWEDMLEVELRALGYRTIRKTISRNERIRAEDVRELYSLCDQILKATIGFREVLDDGTTSPLQDTWQSLAIRAYGTAARDLEPRQALLKLVGEQRIHFLVEEWGRWAKAVRRDNDEEVERDFVATG